MELGNNNLAGDHQGDWQPGVLYRIRCSAPDPTDPEHPRPEDFQFQTDRVFYSVNQSDYVGSGRWLECFRARLQINEKKLQSIVAKRFYSNADIKTHLMQLRVHLVASRLLEIFKLTISELACDVEGWKLIQEKVSSLRVCTSPS